MTDSFAGTETRRPPRDLRRSKGKRQKSRESRRAMREVAQLNNEGFSVPAIASRVRLPATLVERIIDDDRGGSPGEGGS